MSPGKSVHRGTRMVDCKPCGPIVIAGENCRGMNPLPAYPDIFSLDMSSGKNIPRDMSPGKVGFVPGESWFLSPGIVVNVVVTAHSFA
ncbi:hypothetical protein Tco_0163588 [Tanacetum coccineum]